MLSSRYPNVKELYTKDGVPVAAITWCSQTQTHLRTRVRTRAPSLPASRARRTPQLPPRPAARCRPLLRAGRIAHPASAGDSAPGHPAAALGRRARRAHAAHPSPRIPHGRLRCPRSLDRRRPLVSADSTRALAADRAAGLCRRPQPHRRGPRRPGANAPAAAAARQRRL